MKFFRISLVLVFMHLLAQDVVAQLFIGPTVGSNYSWITLDDKELKTFYRVKPVWGYHVGGYIAVKVRKRFFLHTSLLYSTKGKVVEGKIDQQLHQTVRYNFIEMPIAFTVDFKNTFGKGDKEFKYFIGIGPNISYWLNGHGTLFNSDLDEASVGEIDYKMVFKDGDPGTAQNEMYVEDPNRIQLGLNFIAGIGIEPRRNQRFLITFRYELGHSYFSRTSNGIIANTYYQDNLRSATNGLRISMAYVFDTKIAERKKGKSTLRKNDQ